jgi:glycerol-3-phosphate dehydrogenase
MIAMGSIKEVRSAFRHRLERERFDLVVIGGGITGAAVARDAAFRGLKTLILEKDDFASGTSGKSSRMIHGGLRYLEQLRFALVRESLKERAIILRIAPHMVRTGEFLVPFIKGLSQSPAKLCLGLFLYDLLSSPWGLGHFTWLHRNALARSAPSLRRERAYGAAVYRDCTVDDARLTLSTVLSGVQRGLLAFNHALVLDFIKQRGRAVGVVVRDQASGRSFSVRGQALIVAAGPWTNQVAQLDGTVEDSLVRVSKGVHLLVPLDGLSNAHVTVMNCPEDRRHIYIIPWQNYALLGTTDTYFHGDPDALKVTQAEVDYLLGTLNRYFPNRRLKTENVRGAIAGLRPLVYHAGSTETMISREHHLIQTGAGVFFLYGGKLTSHRLMASQAVERIVAFLGYGKSRCMTPWRRLDNAGRLSLHESLHALRRAWPKACGLEEGSLLHLFRTYGGRAFDVLNTEIGDCTKIHPDLDVVWAELEYAARQELACSLSDFMIRRSHLGYLMDFPDEKMVERIADRMGAMLGWTPRDKELELDRYWNWDRGMRSFAS